MIVLQKGAVHLRRSQLQGLFFGGLAVEGRYIESQLARRLDTECS
jgi:hypothetical protein